MLPSQNIINLGLLLQEFVSVSLLKLKLISLYVFFAQRWGVDHRIQIVIILHPIMTLVPQLPGSHLANLIWKVKGVHTVIILFGGDHRIFAFPHRLLNLILSFLFRQLNLNVAFRAY